MLVWSEMTKPAKWLAGYVCSLCVPCGGTDTRLTPATQSYPPKAVAPRAALPVGEPMITRRNFALSGASLVARKAVGAEGSDRDVGTPATSGMRAGDVADTLNCWRRPRWLSFRSAPTAPESMRMRVRRTALRGEPFSLRPTVGLCSNDSNSVSVPSAMTLTASIAAVGGPLCAQTISWSTDAESPATMTSTDPSRRLRTQPRMPSRRACSAMVQREPTPWT